MTKKRELTPRQKRFCEHYAACGSAIEAARLAGYRKPHPQGAENLQKPTIAAYIAQLTAAQDEARVATVKERQEWWTAVMRGEHREFEPKDRLKASELLGKAQGDFLDRMQLTGPNGAPVVPPTLQINFVKPPEPKG